VGAPYRRRAAGHVVGVVGVGEPCRAMVLTSAPRGRDNWGRQSTHVCPRQPCLEACRESWPLVGRVGSAPCIALHCIALHCTTCPCEEQLLRLFSFH
jgi:hypothetical protein